MKRLNEIKLIFQNNMEMALLLIILIVTTIILICYYKKEKKKENKGYYRTRWWNIFYYTMIAYGVIFSVIFIKKSTSSIALLFESFWINVIAFIAGLIVSYVYYKRFYYEKVKETLKENSFYTPFEDLRNLSDGLINQFKQNPLNSKSSLTQLIITQINTNAELIQQKILLYQRFLELEEIASIDSCLLHMKKLKTLDSNLQDSDYAFQYVHEVIMIYICTTNITNKKINSEKVDELLNLSNLITLKTESQSN